MTQALPGPFEMCFTLSYLFNAAAGQDLAAYVHHTACSSERSLERETEDTRESWQGLPMTAAQVWSHQPIAATSQHVCFWRPVTAALGAAAVGVWLYAAGGTKDTLVADSLNPLHLVCTFSLGSE